MSEQKGRLRQPVVVILGHVDSGKCVSGDTLVQLADGRISRAQDLFELYRTGPPIARPDGEAFRARGLELLSVSAGGNVVKREASYVWKLKSERLIRVRTRAGLEIKTTPEHKFLVFQPDGEVRYVGAERLRIGDRLAVPTISQVVPWSFGRTKATILGSLSDGFLIRPDDYLQHLFAGYCKREGFKLAAGATGDKIIRFHVGKGYYRAEAFRRLARQCLVSESEAYNHIQQIKFTTPRKAGWRGSFWLKVPKTHRELTSLYYLVGLLYGDGIRGSGHLSNTSLSLIREYRNSLKVAFGVDAHSAWRRTSYIVAHKGGKTFSEFLTSAFAYPRTDKTRALSIPDLVAAAPNPLAASFLTGFFDAEGWVEKRNNVGVSCKSPELMHRLPILLQRFGCLGYFAKKSRRLELMVSGATNLGAFADHIGFREPEKASLLEAALVKARSNRVFDVAPIDGSFVERFRQEPDVKGRRDFQLNHYQGRRSLTRYSVKTLLSLAKTHTELSLLRNLNSFRTVSVAGIEAMDGNFNVYDFTVDEDHNFLANCMVVHNTSLADALRGTGVQAREVGGITQEIGASYFPMETLKAISGPLLSLAGGELQIPGLLMIDTPGHAVFSNLRLRGGSAADIAILVVDVLKGLENQTLESIDILKQRRVPFLVALNKIDMISGWKKGTKGPLLQVMKQQPSTWNDELEERLYNVVGGLSRLGFQSDAYYRVKDFRQQVSVVPVSARVPIGMPEMLSMLIGLAQQFLKGKLQMASTKSARGIILEMQEEVGIGQTANVILTEGVLHVGDPISLVRREGAFKSKVKALFMPKPLDEMRDPRDKFTPVNAVYAAAGVKLVSADLAGVVAGTSVATFSTDKEFQALRAEMEKELSNVVVKTDNMGVIVKAGSIGGLEALLRMLEERSIPVRQADIGEISKTDIVEAQVVGDHDPYLGAILAFDSKVLPEAKEYVGSNPVFASSIIYEVIDNYVNWAAAKRESDEKAALSSLTRPCKLKVLPGAFFRNRDPAVFGVEVAVGRLKPKVRLMNSEGTELGTLEQIQDQGKSLQEAKEGDQVAISVDGPTLGRQVRENDTIYTMPRSHDAKLLRTKLLGSLTTREQEVLNEIVTIKSASDPMFGF
jgi:translation initiation factor 5B